MHETGTAAEVYLEPNLKICDWAMISIIDNWHGPKYALQLQR